MVARALLTWVIKAVRICMVDLKISRQWMPAVWADWDGAPPCFRESAPGASMRQWEWELLPGRFRSVSKRCSFSSSLALSGDWSAQQGIVFFRKAGSAHKLGEGHFSFLFVA